MLSHDRLPPFSSFHKGVALKMKTPEQHINRVFLYLSFLSFSASTLVFYFMHQPALASEHAGRCPSSSCWLCCINAESTARSPHWSYINLCRWPLRAAARSCGEQGLWSLSAFHKSRCGVIKLGEKASHIWNEAESIEDPSVECAWKDRPSCLSTFLAVCLHVAVQQIRKVRLDFLSHFTSCKRGSWCFCRDKTRLVYPW